MNSYDDNDARQQRFQCALEAARDLSIDSNQALLFVDPARQRLTLYDGGVARRSYPISTSRHGLGCRAGSHQTPTGWHRVADRIGAGAQIGEVFKGRVPQGWQVETPAVGASSDEDLITTRILWLEGLVDGLNRGPGCDSYDRYIYIHGTADESSIGTPASIGCVRMLNRDVIELFEQVPTGMPVYIDDPGVDLPVR